MVPPSPLSLPGFQDDRVHCTSGSSSFQHTPNPRVSYRSSFTGGKKHVCLPHAQALRSHGNQRRPCLPTPRAVCCTFISLPMQRDGVCALTHGLHNQEGASGLLQMGFLNGGVALAKWVCLPFLFWIRRIIHHLHFPATHPAENEVPASRSHEQTPAITQKVTG